MSTYVSSETVHDMGRPHPVQAREWPARQGEDRAASVVNEPPPLEERARAAVRTPATFRSCRELRANLRGADYLVEGYAERNSFAILFGDSDTYKSFIAIDLAMHVATGRNWHGHRVQQGPVFIIAGEGHAGVGRRMDAWMRACSVTVDPPVYVSEHAFALNNEGEAKEVAGEVARLAEESGQMPAMILIDTLARNMDGDENSSEDVGKFIAEVTRHLAHAFRAFVLVVHHVGHADKDRERGSYALRGAADARYLIKSDRDLFATIEPLKMKDGPLPSPLQIALSVIDLGITDNFGNSQSSLAVTSVTATSIVGSKVGRKVAKKLAPERRNLLTAIQSIVGQSGRLVQQTGIPRDLRVADISAARDEFARTFEGGAIELDPTEAKKQRDRRRKAFDRAVDALRAEGLIGCSDGLVWSIPSDGGGR